MAGEHLWGLLVWCSNLDVESVRLRGEGEQSYTFGRDVNCNVVITQNMTNVRIDTLSRLHCTIRRDPNAPPNEQIRIEDHSGNGTFVNRVRIDKETYLRHGNVIAMSCQFGEVFTYLDSNPDINNNFPSAVKHDYFIVRKLGEGAYGQVWLSVHKQTNRKNAIKHLAMDVKKLNNVEKTNFKEKWTRELTSLQKLNHPFVVKLEASICTRHSICLVLELMNGGDLRTFLNENGQLEEATAKYFFMQMVMALRHIHDNNVVHRDLKPANILMSSENKNAILKITDFGLAKLVDNQTQCQTYCGTPLYLAPEVERSPIRRPYTKAVDVWSLGVILFQMLAGYHPFDQSRSSTGIPLSTGDCIATGPNWLDDKREAVSPYSKQLIEDLLQRDPNKRPEVVAILSYPWMTDGDVITKVEAIQYAAANTNSHQRH